MTAPGIPRWKKILAASLLILSLLYWGKGFYFLIWKEKGAIDLLNRWTEQQYVLKGQNPFDVAFREFALAAGRTPPLTPRNSEIDPQIGMPAQVDYPPFAYFPGIFLFWMDRSIVRISYAFVDAFALGLLILLVRRRFISAKKEDRCLVLLSVTSTAAISTDLAAGNYGILLLTLIMASLVLQESGRWVSSGILLGISLLKPSFSGPFVLTSLAKRRISTQLAATLYIGIACGVIWGITHTNPLEMTLQMFSSVKGWVQAGYSPLNFVIFMGIPYSYAVPITATAILGLFLVLLWKHRHADLLTHFALASVAARFWTYHMSHSNLILVFLLLKLWQLCLEKKSAVLQLALAATCVSLWLPSGITDWVSVRIFQHVVWASSIAIALIHSRNERPVSVH